jgi:hypothetical protein
MEPNNNSIITEDGQRLTVKDGRITGTEDPGPGLAYETDNVSDENNRSDNEKGKTYPANESSNDSANRE